MKTVRFIKTLATVAAGTVLATNAFAQSAKEVLGATPYVANRRRT
jgi:ABC-type sugar transport system substrate-binding protein